MKVALIVGFKRVTMIIREEHTWTVLLSHDEADMPSTSLLNVPPVVPFNPFPGTWQGPSEPPIERM